MALTKTFPTQDAAGLSITDTRRVLAGLIVRNADGTPRAGVFPSNSSPIVSGRASMGYNVAPFLAATSRLSTGVELVANDALVVVNTTAAPASNSRIDVIWVRARFLQHADGSNLPEFGVTQGVAAAVPTKPAIPAGALELATAEILSTTTTTATAVFTQSAPYTAAAGGTVLVRSLAELNDFAAADGTSARLFGSPAVYQRVGTSWVTDDSGDIAITAMGAGWSATSGHPPRVRRVGKRVDLLGAVTSSGTSAVANIATIPSGYRPPSNVFLGTVRGSGAGNFIGTLFSGAAGIIQMPAGYFGGTFGAGVVIPLIGTWYLD